MIHAHNGIVITVGIQVFIGEAAGGGGGYVDVIRRHKPMEPRRIPAGAEAIQTNIRVVVVSAVAEEMSSTRL